MWFPMWDTFVTATRVEQVLELLAKYRQDVRVINGGTDLIIEIERMVRSPKVVVDVSRISGLNDVSLEDGVFHLGAGVTHNQAAGHKDLFEKAFPLASACWQVGTPRYATAPQSPVTLSRLLQRATRSPR